MKICVQLSLIIALLILSMEKAPVSAHMMEDLVTEYIVEFPDDRCSSAPNPEPVTVTIPSGSRALIVMQEAADKRSDLRFTTTFSRPDHGYFIDIINGTADRDGQSNCFWFIYIRDPEDKEILSPLSVSNYILPGTGYSIIWRFELYDPETSTHDLASGSEPIVERPTRPQPEETVIVRYSIEYEDNEICSQGLELVPPPLVDTEIGLLGSAQRVMEEATNFGRNYRFTVTYFNNELGYFVEAINGTTNNVTNGCFWLFYVHLPNGTECQPEVGITNYAIPSDGHTVIMRYQFAEHGSDAMSCSEFSVKEAQSRPQMLFSMVMLMTFLAIIPVLDY